jgi:hypothetical protein
VAKVTKAKYAASLFAGTLLLRCALNHLGGAAMMPEPKEELLPTVDESEDTTVSLPVDTDHNDEPNADASGDSDDEKADENEAPEEWLEGEL